MGRKCEYCFMVSVGSCPFGYACRLAVWELYPLGKRFNVSGLQGQKVSNQNQLYRHQAVCLEEEKRA